MCPPPPTVLDRAQTRSLLYWSLRRLGAPLTLDRVPCYALHDFVLLQSLIVGVNHPFIAPPIYEAYPCNTIARPLRNIRPPTDPSLYAIHNRQLVMAISCKGQVPCLARAL